MFVFKPRLFWNACMIFFFPNCMVTCSISPQHNLKEHHRARTGSVLPSFPHTFLMSRFSANYYF